MNALNKDNTAGHAREEWNAIWDRKVQKVLGYGRKVYNRYFDRVLAPHASHQSRFLEIGCGTASLLCDLAPRFSEAVGLDISERALLQAEERKSQKGVNNLSLVLGDCFKMPFPDESFDLVWSQGLHEHFDNYSEILKEEYRVCKTGGYVYVGVPYRYSYPTIWYLISRLPGCRKAWPWTEQVFFKIDEILPVCRSIAPHSEAFVMKPWI